jgi:hypothetical protein
VSCANVVAVESESITPAGRTPPQTTVGKLAFSRQLGKVKVDVIEALPVEWSVSAKKQDSCARILHDGGCGFREVASVELIKYRYDG